MKRILSGLVVIGTCCLFAFGALAAKKAGTQAQVVQPDAAEGALVSGIQALDPAIASVRPASVREPGRAQFPIVWTPAVTLRSTVGLEQQLALSQKVAQFVVSCQGGVPTSDVRGGVLACVEGDGWNPEIGQVFYRVDQPGKPAEAWVAVRTVDDIGNTSCCEDAGRIGRIVGARFEAESTAKLPGVINEILKKARAGK